MGEHVDYHILNKIDDPADIKELSEQELQALAQEIRHFLIYSIAETGGHLASNLGVVELTIALHRVFNAPEDKIVWDVGHQGYVHKMLTGRLSRFGTLRKLDGLSGFPKSAESPYDAFDTGHASTAVSAALGIAAARDLSDADYRVVAVVGDGSMTGGMTYEALNNAGQLGSNLIIILNDNGMSISESVGGLSRYLSGIRTKRSYIRAKEGVKDFFGRLPFVGKPINNALFAVKNALKDMLVKGGIFQDLGFNYIGPLNGHDLPKLIKVLSRVYVMDGPILLHVHTTKGKGYGKAESAPDNFHGVGSFNVNTGIANTDKSKITYSDVFGYGLMGLAMENKRVCAVTAAMPEGTGLSAFQKAFPDRFFDVGIAEGHAVTFAAGLAKAGMIPVVAVYSTFLQRGYDQLIHDVCLQNLHVVFAIDRAGVVGPDGETHQGLFDLSYLLHMPNMRVLCPKDRQELEHMLAFAVTASGPVAVRYPRSRVTPVFENLNEANANAAVDKAETIISGDGTVAIVTIGAMAEHGYAACKKLAEDGFYPALINARSAKPIDPALLAALAGYRHVFTAEDNVYAGGFGERLLSELNFSRKPDCGHPAVHLLAFPDAFIAHGQRGELLKLHGLDGCGIYKSVKAVLSADDARPC